MTPGYNPDPRLRNEPLGPLKALPRNEKFDHTQFLLFPPTHRLVLLDNRITGGELVTRFPKTAGAVEGFVPSNSNGSAAVLLSRPARVRRETCRMKRSH